MAEIIVSSGVTSTGCILDDGIMYVYPGGTANSTTVGSRGMMRVSSGGFADSTTVNSDGNAYVSGGGLANNTEVHDFGWLHVSSGGTANTVALIGNGILALSSGGTALNVSAGENAQMDLPVVPDTYLQGTHDGSAFEMKDGVLSGFTVKASIRISSGGTAVDTTVSGGMDVSSGGVADGVTLKGYGRIYVSSGGTATNINADHQRSLYLTVAPNTYIQGTAGGSAFEMKDAYLSGFRVRDVELCVVNGGVVDGAIVNSHGSIYLESGGTANNTILSFDRADGDMQVSEGCVANNTTINAGGRMEVYGGVARDVTVGSGGYLTFARTWTTAGKLTGRMTFESGAQVALDGTNILDFDLTRVSAGEAALVNDLSVIQGTPACTLTVNGDLDAGTYRLADGAAGFNRTITMVNSEGTEIVTISVGRAAAWHDTTCELVLSDGSLILKVGAEYASNGLILTNGTRTVESGETFSNTLLLTGGTLIVSGGGTAEHATVDSGGRLFISGGGSAVGITENGGCVEFEEGAYVTFLPNEFGNLDLTGLSATLHSGTTASFLANPERLFIGSGGTAIHVSGGKTVEVDRGGTAYDIVSGGTVIIRGGGTANDVLSAGSILIENGGTANNVNGGILTIAGGGIAVNVSNGAVSLAGGATVYNVSGGSMAIANGAVAVNLSGGSVSIASGGTANGIAVESRGALLISSGGTATDILWTPGVGNLEYEAGAHVTFVSQYSGVYYAKGDRLVSQAQTISSGSLGGTSDRLYVMSGGTASGTTVRSGKMVVSGGGVADDTVVSSGSFTVFDGGVANNIIVSTRAVFQAYSGGTATGVTLKSGTSLVVSEGVVLNSVSVETGGYLYISGGGTAECIQENGGYVDVQDGARVSFLPGVVGRDSFHSSATAHSGTVIQSSYISSSACLLVFSGGTACANRLYGSGRILVSSGGAANSNNFFDGGFIHVSNGGAADGNILSGGAIHVSSGGTANGNILINSGSLHVSAGGTANKTTIGLSTTMHVSGGIAGDSVINGSLTVFSGGTANGNILNSTGRMVVSYGGTATSTIISAGTAYVAKDGLLDSAEIHQGRIMVSSGGTANGVYLNSGGTLTVLSGGTATLTFNPWDGGKIVSSGGAFISYLERDANVYYGRDALLISKTDVLESGTIDAGNSAIIYSGGQADLSTIGEKGVLLLSGGRANGTTVNSGGNLFVDDGGTAGDTIVNSGGTMFVSSGGAADKTTVGLNAALYISGGAVAIDTLVSRGKMFVDGVMEGAVVARTAVCTVSSGGRADDVIISSGGTLSILRGGTAEGAIVLSSGRFAVSGGAANGISVGKGGKAFLFSGGVLDGAVVDSLGQLTVANGGKVTGKMTWATDAVVSAGSNAVFDFDLTRTSAGAEALISNLSCITGTPKYTLVVDGTQEDGTYTLADGAALFNSTISVTNPAGSELGSLTLAGGTQEIDGTKYTLNLADGLLSVTVGEPPAPPLPDWTFHPGDFNGDGFDTLAVQKDSVVTIYQNGEPWGLGLTLDPGWSVVGTGDFNGDNLDDFLRVNTEGYVVGEMSNGNGTFTPQVLNLKNAGWDILGTGNFDGVGPDDVLIANPTAASETVGLLGYWKGGTEWTLINGYSPEWTMVSTGDFNGDGKCDMLWKNSFVGEGGLTYNAYCTWIVEDPVDWRMVSVANPDEWNFLCSGDFDGNGSHDIAMINNVGVVGIWGVLDGYLGSWSILSAVTNEWQLAGVADFNADGTDDIAWSNTDTGLTGYWQINNKELTTWANIATIG